VCPSYIWDVRFLKVEHTLVMSENVSVVSHLHFNGLWKTARCNTELGHLFIIV
jgi:hypothetical protein